MTAKITAAGLTAAFALSGLAPAGALAKADGPGRHTVSKTTYVFVKPAAGWSGTIEKGATFKVKRLSPSGKWAYGMAYGEINRHVWISAAALDRRR